MKIFKIVFISFAVLIAVLAIAVFIFLKFFDINRYKPQIISQANKVLAREVDFQKAELGLSLFQGISLKISGFSISDDPAFSSEKFLVVKEISAGVDVLGYLLRKKISITSVFIDSPQVRIIRRKDGSLNAQTIAQPSEAGKDVIKSSPAAAVAAIPAIFVSTIKNVNGTVIYIDHSFEPPLRLEAADLSFAVRDVSLSGYFSFEIEAAVLSAKKNIRIEGQASFDLKTNEVVISELKAVTELSNILLNQIPVVFPMAKGAVLPAELKGSFNLTVRKLIAGPKGLRVLSADGALTKGVLVFKELASPIQNIGAKIKITEKNIFLEQLSAAIGGGGFSGSGALEDYLVKQNYSVSADIKDLKLRDIIIQDNSPVKAEGIVSAKIKVNGAGFSPEALRSNLSGNADISLIKAKLKDLNVLRAVLDKTSVIPGLSEKIEAGLPERYKQKLAQQDTALTDTRIPAIIEKGRIIIKDLALGADEFIFKGSAEAGLSGVYSLEGAFLIPADLSAAMVSAVSELQYLLNAEKQIYIPLKVSGQAGKMKFNVDAQYIVQKLVSTQVTRQIFKAIDKALGKKETESVEQNAAPPAESEKSSTEEAVSNLLNSIFKKK